MRRDLRSLLTANSRSLLAHGIASMCSRRYSPCYPALSNAETLTFMDQLGARKLLSRISQVDSKGVTQTWDASNNLLTRTDAEGRVSKFTYNATRQRITMTEAFGTPEARTTTYEYLSPTVDLVTKEITASVASGQQRQRIVNYNPNRTIASITIQGYKPDGTPVLRTTTFLYNTKGQVTKIDGPRTDVADVTLFSYYECSTGGECGQLATMTNALGHVTYFNNYDAHGRLTQKTDPNGLVTNYSYDLRGRLLSVQEGNRTTSYTYDLAGQLATVSAPNGRVLTYQYDAAHDVRSITDNAGNKITYTYDLRGNRATEDKRDPLNALTEAISYTYDLRNRIDTINSSGSITDLLFDKIGNLKQNVDANNHSSTYGYDALRRLRQTIDASSNQTNFSYGNQGLTLVQAPNGALTGYAYDDLGNLLSSSSPDTGTQSYTYDAAGNRTSMTDSRGVLTSYTYDAINRISSITYPTTSLNRTFVYDAGVNQKGRLTSAVDAGGTTSYAYDVSGATTTQSRTISGHTFTLAYGYDTAGQLSTMNYPSSGRNVAYTRNALGQITAVSTTLGGVTTTVANQVQYLPFGAPRSFVYGNGIAAERHYDQQYRLDLLRDVGAATLRDYSYTYDAGGNIDRIQDNLTTNAQDIGQDVLDRVISDTGAYGALTYIYDSVGNRTQRKRGAAIEQTITYAANGNRLDTLNGLSFTYDAAGNTLFDPVYSRAFTYDDSNRLTELRVGGVLQATYLYASNGQRIKTTEATGAQRRIYYHYGLARELIGETFYNSADQKIAEREYIWVGSLPLAFTEQAYDPVTGAVIASQLAYLHPDHLGTPRLATNPSQQLVWQWSSDAFGVGTVQTDPDGDMIDTNIALRLPGQHFDAESGLSYNYYRDYDPSTGRYLESDPLGLEGGLNTYLYSDANPLIKSDPTGENPAAVRAAFWTGTRIGGAISYGIQAATGATIGALIYDACHDDPNECDEKYVECLLTSLSDKPGGVSEQTRCAFCRGFCERQRKWPTRAPTTTGSVRCDYWNYSRVPE